MRVNKTDWLAVRLVMLMGSAIYLFLLATTMVVVATRGSMLWHADFLLQHGEPILVFLLALFCIYEALMIVMAKL